MNNSIGKLKILIPLIIITVLLIIGWMFISSKNKLISPVPVTPDFEIIYITPTSEPLSPTASPSATPKTAVKPTNTPKATNTVLTPTKTVTKTVTPAS
jgi:hypothetical protein